MKKVIMTGSEQCSDGASKHTKISIATLLRPPYDVVNGAMNSLLWLKDTKVKQRYVTYMELGRQKLS